MRVRIAAKFVDTRFDLVTEVRDQSLDRWNFARILFGLFVGTSAIVGFALTLLSMPMRWVYGLVSLPIVLPPEAVTGGYTINFIGIAAGIALLVFDHLRRKKAAATAAPA